MLTCSVCLSSLISPQEEEGGGESLAAAPTHGLSREEGGVGRHRQASQISSHLGRIWGEERGENMLAGLQEDNYQAGGLEGLCPMAFLGDISSLNGVVSFSGWKRVRVFG